MFINPQLDILSNSGSFKGAEQKTDDRYLWFIRDAYAYRLYKNDLLLDTTKFVYRTWTIDFILGYEPPEVITAEALQSFGLHEVKQRGEYKAAGSSVTECVFYEPPEVITAKVLRSFGLHEVKQRDEYKAAGSSVTECVFSTRKDGTDGTFEVYINKAYIKKFPASCHFFAASPLKPVVVTQDPTENIMGLIMPIRSNLNRK